MEIYENFTLNITVYNNCIYYCNDTNLDSNDVSIVVDENERFYYKLVTLLLILFSAFSVTVNAVILMSFCWIRRPISPTLHISLSLAASDMFTSLVYGIGLVINSLIPIGLNIQISICTQLFLEALRMGGLFTSLGHLLGLAVNHYLGIKKPLHHPSLMTTRNITVIALALWILPASGFLIHFSLIKDDGFSIDGCGYEFIKKTEFRSSCCYIFLACLITMAAIYTHIYLLVRKHQANRNRFRRAGSSYSRNAAANDLRLRQTRNEKALRTTLLIVGTVVLGWLPATLYFYLVCDDCIFKLNWDPPIVRLFTNAFINSLIMLKTTLNSYIYAARMHEIKAALKLMRLRVKTCCKLGNERDEQSAINSELSRNFISRTSTRRSRRTVLYRLQSIPRNEYPLRGENGHNTARL
ncbi:hypothetical protein O3M35_002405 [Rhynocoris fuscipes]|uniref:G-protein coupled receptors family 1 profile domain-containing protein n=1 Tax=Rhynocoris fuscipes TaxID=488301 RepID=A0AAW1CM06_9HEMI